MQQQAQPAPLAQMPPGGMPTGPSALPNLMGPMTTANSALQGRLKVGTNPKKGRKALLKRKVGQFK